MAIASTPFRHSTSLSRQLDTTVRICVVTRAYYCRKCSVFEFKVEFGDYIVTVLRLLLAIATTITIAGDEAAAAAITTVIADMPVLLFLILLLLLLV